MDKKSVKMVVFDMAGTTVDEQKTVYMCVREALAEFGFDYTLDEVVNRIGGMNKREGIALLMKAQEPQINDDAVQVVFESFKKNVEQAYQKGDNLKEMEGASELFEYLKANNIKVVLDTGYYRTTADILIGKMGWADKGLVDFSVTSDEVEAGRPAPFMIEKAMAEFGIDSPEEVAKVGDTRSDIEEGKNTKCRFIVGISSEQYGKQDLMEMGATHAIDQLSELKAILNQG
ncbi:HAD hydrolase-like protein [Roseivirga pacifica]|uniref:HAD hydrolase-like protein n=1 Tax=Roseivirga pacifica TaxID=1267423 RepID=UPI00227B61C8|nr:HAD hydrolase-like protein [Roseivirga pacifica]